MNSTTPPTPASPKTELKGGLNEFSVVFIHSRLDDYGLAAPVFRIYCHLARRAGRDVAWPAVATMAKVCRLHPQTVRKALQILVRHRLITRELRSGTTPIYHLTPSSQWQPPASVHGDLTDSDTPPSASESTPTNPIYDHPSETDGVKGYPIEGIPMKVKPHSPQGDSVLDKDLVLVQAEEIYQAYPKQVGKPAALRAIRRALGKKPFDVLLERTRLYAQTCNSPMQFIPLPATWFNQERFNDDASTWRRTTGVGGNPQPAIIQPDKFGCGVSKL